MPYRISGHESFACRYAWLPKAVKHVSADPSIFSDEQRAMVALGVGKNMVRAVRFWALAADIIAPQAANRYAVTQFGNSILGSNGGDPFLEDIRTLWLIHWKLATNVEHPLLAWDFLLSRWQEPEIVRSTILKALHKEALNREQQLSLVTIEQHLEVFLHTYVATRGRKGDVQEDNLDSPFVELELLMRIGEREIDGSGRREPVYVLRREEKPEISPKLFAYCVTDFWKQRYSNEETLPADTVANAHGSPGQIFKLRDDDVRERLREIGNETSGALEFSESASLQQLRRQRPLDATPLLQEMYAEEVAYA